MANTETRPSPDYLLDVLDPAQAVIVLRALRAGLPILIDGTRKKATGKSTLARYLRSLGADVPVFEAWELEESGAELANGNTNYAFVHIILDKPIANPDLHPWYVGGQTPGTSR